MKNTTPPSASEASPSAENRRHFSRVHFTHQLILTGSSGRTYPGAFNDVSLKGMLFWCDILPEKGETVAGVLALGDASLHIRGLVVNAHPDRGAAVFFKDMDVESFSHLRRLISLNMGDSETIDQEFFSSL